MAITNIIADHDTFGFGGAGDTNYGSEIYLYLNYTTVIRRIVFLHFLTTGIPSGDIINSAILKMYVGDYMAGADLNPVYKNVVGFDEAQLTWNNKPAKTGDLLGYMPINVGSAWAELDITALFNGWHKGTIDNYGIQIEPEPINFGMLVAYWWSSEQANYEPYITVNHETGVIIKTFEDTFLGSDSLLSDKKLIFLDLMSGTDKWVLPEITYKIFSDVLVGSDNFLRDLTALFEDTFSGADIIKVDKMVIFSDTFSGVDVFLVDKEAIYKDVFSAIEKFYASYPYPRDLKRKIIIIRDIK